MSAWNASNKSELIISSYCVYIIGKQIPDTRIKYFDLFLLLPSASFFVFLVVHCHNILQRVVSNASSIITTFYVLLFLGCSLKLVRAVVAMVLNSHDDWVQIVDKVLWLVVRFFLLATEMSIVTFGVAAARLDSRTGIRRVLAVTSCIALTYTLVQASLEFAHPDTRFRIKNYSLYGHGGALFFFASSLCLFLVYCSVLVLPLTRCSSVLRLPTKRMFYVYCSILALLYALLAVGSILFYLHVQPGLCVISIGSLVYFACYDPLVYATFLHNYFKSRKALAFKYTQHQTGASSAAVSADYPTDTVSDDDYYHHKSSHDDRRDGAGTYSISSGDKPHDDECSQQLERSTHFYPDQLVTVERAQTDVFSIHEILKRFNILPAGARLDYASRHPSTVSGSGGDPHHTGMGASSPPPPLAPPPPPLSQWEARAANLARGGGDLDEIDGSIVLSSVSDDGDLLDRGYPLGEAWDMKHFASQRH